MAGVAGDRPLRPDARRGAARRGRPAAAPGDPVERRPRRGRGGRAPGARRPRARPRSPGRARDARLHGPEAALAGRARARDCSRATPRVLLPKDYDPPAADRRARHRRRPTPPAPGGSTRRARDWCDAERSPPPACRRPLLPRARRGHRAGRRGCGPNSRARWGLPPGIIVAGGAGDAPPGADRHRRGRGGRRLRLARHLGASSSSTTASLPRRAPERWSTPSAMPCPAAGSRWRRC